MKIFRRDFLNNSLLAAGAALLHMPSPSAAQGGAGRDTFTGYGGVGDYALSNGDTWPVLTAGHKIAQGAYTPLPGNITDTLRPEQDFQSVTVATAFRRWIID